MDGSVALNILLLSILMYIVGYWNGVRVSTRRFMSAIAHGSVHVVPTEAHKDGPNRKLN